MGNDISTPHTKNIKKPKYFNEYLTSKLVDIREAADFWITGMELDGKESVNREEFDEIFGHIFKDSDIHFKMFLPKGYRVVDPYPTFCILALFCVDSVTAKINFFYHLYFEGKQENSEACFARWFRHVLDGMHSIFDMEVCMRDVAGDAAAACVKHLKSAQRTENEILNMSSEVEERDTGGSLRFADVMQSVQENHAVSMLADSLLQMSLSPQSVTTSSYSTSAVTNMLAESKLMASNNQTRPKSRLPLWRFTIMDMYDDSWLHSLPQVHVNTTVFSILELIFCSGKSALPVYTALSAPDSATATSISVTNTIINHQPVPRAEGGENKRTMTSSQVIKANEKALMAAAEAERIEMAGHPASTFHLHAIVDEFTILLWLAEACPKTILQPAVPRLSVSALSEKRKSSAGVVNPTEDRRTSYRRDLVSPTSLRGSLMFAMPTLANRNRRSSFGGSVQNQWQELAMEFAGCTMQSLLKKITPNSDSPTGPQRCEVMYSCHNIYQTDQFVYNVLDMMAKGYRNVPVAASRIEPYKVSHIITTTKMASFLRLYSHEILGKLSAMTVEESGMMRSPVLVDVSSNFGSAIQILAERKVEAAAIVDEMGRWCGRLDAKCISEFWWAWREHIIKPGLRHLTREDLRVAFTRGYLDAIDFNSISNFSIFSMLLSPLKECGIIGIHIKDFDEFMSDKPPSLEDLNESDESTTDDSSTTDSDSDESETSETHSQLGVKGAAYGVSRHRTQSSATATSEDVVINRMDSRSSRGSSRGNKGMALSHKNSGPSSPVGSTKRPSTAEDEIRRQAERAAKHEKLKKWFLEMGVIQAHDTIATALEVMHQYRSSKSFVVNTQGEVLGVISIRDIAKELIQMEKRQQLTRAGMQVAQNSSNQE